MAVDFVLLTTWLLAAYGLTNIVVSSKITRKFRLLMEAIWKDGFGYWVNCFMCFGFSAGILLYLIGFRLEITHSFFRDMLLSGLISSAWCWIMRVILAKLGEDNL